MRRRTWGYDEHIILQIDAEISQKERFRMKTMYFT